MDKIAAITIILQPSHLIILFFFGFVLWCIGELLDNDM